MKIDLDPYRITEGADVDLGKRPTRVKPLYGSSEEYEAALRVRVDRLGKLHELFYAADSHALLVVLQGMDTAGKDGVIRHVLTGLNPQGCQVTAFKQPSVEELHHDFLWRAYRVMPPRGGIGIFNRSYYEEVIVVRVHPEMLAAQGLDSADAGKKFWRDRYRAIVEMERHLHRSAARVVKVFLHISLDEQRERLLARIEDPDKNWKFGIGDIAERARWPHYMKAYEHALAATSTDEAPWFVVPADDKDTSRLIAAEIVLQALEGMDLRYPEVTADRRRELQAIRSQLEESSRGDGPSPKRARVGR